LAVISFILAIFGFLLIGNLPTYASETSAELLYFFPILLIFVGIYAIMKD